MALRRVLVGERRDPPSGQQLRKQIRKSRTAKGFRMQPGFIYTVVRAISARINQNYDGWPADELKKSYHTFIGKPVFVNHENYDPKLARGVVVAARYVEAGDDKYIEVIQEIDAQRFPKLAHEIKTGGLDSVSMGAEAAFTICSFCSHRATDESDMCDHVRFHKGDRLRKFNRRTGKVDDILVYESCHKLSFFELSYVFDPADETAVASKVLVASVRKEAPFAGYKDFAACVAANQDKGDPEAYCGSIKHKVEGARFEARVLEALSSCPPGAVCEKSDDPAANAPGGGNGAATGTPAVATPATPATPSTTSVTSPGGGTPSANLTDALTRAGIDPSMHALISGFSVAEGNNPSGAPTLGFTDDQAGNTLDSHAQALSKQIKDRASVAGEFPSGGTPEQQASWMATVVGQNGVSSDWQGNAQPARSDYVNRIVQNMPSANTTPSPDIVTAHFERQVLRMAGYKTAWPGATQEKTHAPSQWAEHPDGGWVHPDGGRVAPSDEAPGTYQLYGPTVGFRGPSGEAKLKRPSADPQALMDWYSWSSGEGPKPQGVGFFGSTPPPMGREMPNFEAAVLKAAGYKLAWGETEAPPEVNTLREEGSAPEDDNDDFHHYVEPADDDFANYNDSPQELLTPDLEAAGNIDREQDQTQQQPPMAGGAPPAAAGAPPAQPQPQMMTLQIPMPTPQPNQQQGLGQMPMQAFAHRVLTAAGYNFDAHVENVTLENGRGVSGTSRKPRKGTTMGRSNSTLAERGKVASRGRRQHFADQSRNDQGEQEEAFLTQTPPPEPVDMPADDEPNITNTESNLVAKVNQGRQKLLADAKQLAAFQAGKKAGARKTAESISMERADEVNPTVNTGPEAEALTGDHFESVGESPVPTQPSDSHEASLRAFQAFDRWLHQVSGKQARHLTETGIKRAATEYAKRSNSDVQALFPALGIVLRQARKNETAIKAAAKGAQMRKQAVDLEVAAPDGRVDVERPVADTTNDEAQKSQFDLDDFGHNAGDALADPDLDTDSQFWAPGEGSKKSSRKTQAKAGGILAVRCAEAYIRAGLEPNTQERKYQLAGLFEHMNRGAVQRDIALLERVASLQSQQRPKVASGGTRGAATPIPPGLTQSGTRRSASTRRTSANDPSNDALLFG